MGLFTSHKTRMVDADRALPGRDEAMPVTAPHRVLGHEDHPSIPRTGSSKRCSGWGASGVPSGSSGGCRGSRRPPSGYAGGMTPNPTYREVCRGRTGHAEVVLVVFDPAVITYERLVGVFFEGHDPTQGMRQGNDVGTQYRSSIYTTSPEQAATAQRVAERFAASLREAGYGAITTEIAAAGDFYYAEPYHQQYLAANPRGYCGLGGTGVACPVGLAETG